jgi:hypothetical protein
VGDRQPTDLKTADLLEIERGTFYFPDSNPDIAKI